ncbi:uncharacterized protein LOC132246459 [Alligator mississippiensis]|uniref:uncharacterized protein LOC132246459 n=1 Tax=Alligator mississippiensis TaxID=8496 RepID=UPI002877FD16|nr:uncharacterized protein LOC132246459 [Alligator mississippiensis]XP_059575577.1 uncharacterized protein LOC132246459 [Alligator mississippiensis]
MGNEVSPKRLCASSEKCKAQEAVEGSGEMLPTAQSSQEVTAWIDQSWSFPEEALQDPGSALTPVTQEASAQTMGKTAVDQSAHRLSLGQRLQVWIGKVPRARDVVQTSGEVLQGTEAKPPTKVTQDSKPAPKNVRQPREAPTAVESTEETAKPGLVAYPDSETPATPLAKQGVHASAWATDKAEMDLTASEVTEIWQLRSSQAPSTPSKEVTEDAEHSSQPANPETEALVESQTRLEGYLAVCKRLYNLLLTPSPLCRWLKKAKSSPKQ